MTKAISIIIPAYNEEKRIGKTLHDYLPYFQKEYKNNFEIIVVLNGCKDATLNIVKQYAHYSQLRYKNITSAIGKGGAVIEGFKLAQGKLVGFVDADDSTKAKEFHKIQQHLADADGIIASRWIRGAVTRPPQPLYRRIASRAFNILVRILFQLPLRDTQCGSKLFRREAIQKVLPQIGITSWAFDIDLLYQLKKNHYRIIETPITWENNTNSTLRIRKAAIEMFLAITRLRLLYSPLAFIVTVYDRIILFIKRINPF